MSKTLFINEEFFKRVIPTHRSVNEEELVSAIRLVQEVDLPSLVTEDIVNYIDNKIITGGTFTADEEVVFKDMQLYLAVAAAEQLTYNMPKGDDQSKSISNVAFRNKISALESRIIRNIKRSPTLLQLAQISSQTFAQEEEMELQGGFYFG